MELLEFSNSLLVTQDVKSMLGFCSSLREFLRFESLPVIREIEEKSVEEKLLVVDFFVRAFALAGDVEACERALLCFEMNDKSYSEADNYAENMQLVEKIKT